MADLAVRVGAGYHPASQIQPAPLFVLTRVLAEEGLRLTDVQPSGALVYQGVLVATLAETVHITRSLSQSLNGSQPVIFRADFSDDQPPGADEPCQYNFPFKYPDQADNSFTHLPTGSYNGGPCCEITVHDGVFGNVTNGWGFQTSAWSTFCATAVSGTSFFLRFTYSVPSGQIWRHSNKMILVGAEEGRSVVFQRYAPTDNYPCTLGGGASSELFNPPDFGFAGSVTTWDHASVNDLYHSIDITQNVSNDGAGPILIGNVGSDKPVGSGIPADGIYHIQIQVTIGGSGVAAYRIWSNNNVQGSPSRSITTGFVISVTDFNNEDPTGVFGMVFGDQAPATIDGDHTWRVHRFEVGETFDPLWFPG